jgi:excisionase family DNA binding protein
MMAQTSSDEDRTRLAVTYREAAESLGVCERVVWQLVKDGKLQAVRIGRSVRIPVKELERFVSNVA